MSIIVENLVKNYGKQKALNEISFELKKGEIVGFLGPNGAGKSTTMKIATGYIRASSGRVHIAQYEVHQNPLEVKKRIGYLPEHNPLYKDLYIKEYLRFIGSLHKIKSLKKRVDEVISLCGLFPEKHKKIGTLSKGYQQRVGLAQALIHEPDVLILDEPTTGLDPNQILEIRNLIKSISINKTILFSTHIMQEVEALCNRAIIINKGNIVADGKLNELTQSGGGRIVIHFDTPVDQAQINAIEAVDNVEHNEGNIYSIQTSNPKKVQASLLQLASQMDWVISSLYMEENNLEEVFRKLTK